MTLIPSCLQIQRRRVGAKGTHVDERVVGQLGEDNVERLVHLLRRPLEESTAAYVPVSTPLQNQHY